MADLISVQELTAKTETSLTIRWSSNAVINYVWYSTNNGSSYTGLSVTEGTTGSFDISGLSANTSYQVKTKVRRKSDNAIKESAAATFKTYALAKVIDLGANYELAEIITQAYYCP